MVRKHFIVSLICVSLLSLNAGPAHAQDIGSPVTTPAQVITALNADVTDLGLTALPGSTAVATINVAAPSDTAISVSADGDWLTCTPSSFKGSTVVTVTASARGRTPGDVLMGTVTLNGGPAGTTAIPVVLTVALPGDGPVISANPSRLDLDTVEANKVKVQKVTLQFAVPLSGVITTDAAWLDVQPRTFTNATQQVVLVKATTNNMIQGQVYTGSVAVRSGNYPTLQVPVILKVGNPPPPKRAFKSTFRDLPDDHWALEAIMTLSETHVINGIGNALFAPDQLVSREQFAKLLTGALRLPLADVPTSPIFRDLPADRWSAAYVTTVKQYLTGYQDGLFRPESPATREDMAVALVKAKGFMQEAPADPAELDALFSDAGKIAPALRQHVGVAVSKGLMKGFDDGTYRPQEPLTRAQAAVLLYRASQVGGNEKH